MVTQCTNSNRAALICSSAAAVLIQDRSSPSRCFKSVKSRNGLTKLREGQSRKSGQQRHVVLTRGDVLSSSPSSPERLRKYANLRTSFRKITKLVILALRIVLVGQQIFGAFNTKLNQTMVNS